MNGPVIGGQHWAFGSGRAERISTEALPQLATDAPWPVGQPIFGLVVRSRVAATVHGRPRGPWSQIRPQPLEPRGDRHRGRQLLARIDARPRVGLGEERRGRAGRRRDPPGGVDAAFTLWHCCRSRGHQSCESTCESHRAADSTSRSRQPSATPCTAQRAPDYGSPEPAKTGTRVRSTSTTWSTIRTRCASTARSAWSGRPQSNPIVALELLAAGTWVGCRRTRSGSL